MTGAEILLVGSDLVGKALISQGIKSFLFEPALKYLSTEKYEIQLNRIIAKTIEEYRIENPILEAEKKYPFYDSAIIFEELSKVIFFQNTELNLLEAIKTNPNCLIPTEKQINDFYSLFIKKIQADEDLKKLFIKENYEEEVFRISQKINDIDNSLVEIKNLTRKIPEIVSGIEKLGDDLKGIIEKTGFDPAFEFAELFSPDNSTSDLPFGSQRKVQVEHILEKGEK